MHRTSMHSYQEEMANHFKANLECAAFAEIGTGKTISTLSALRDMRQFPVLIVAPLLVAQTVWSQEGMAWDHTRGMNFVHVLGTATQRTLALEMPGDVYIINRENLPWLAKQKYLPEFKVIVLDELSGYRRPGGARVKAVRKLRQRFRPRMIGLTGTPAPNGLLGLFSQIKCLDGGARLGANYENFKRRLFEPTDYMGYTWEPREGTEETIKEKLSNMVIAMKTEDYLELPGRMDNTFEIILPPTVLERYKEFERSSVLESTDEEGYANPITAVNAAVLCGKLTQMASGRVYEGPDELGESTGIFRSFHTEKARVLNDILHDMQGEPVLVAYWYKHSKDAILGSGLVLPEITAENIEKWNNGEIPAMLIHPASAGHGLNLQKGGHQIVWYDMIYDLELYEQLIGRLDRQGQTKPVFNHLLIAHGTVDETIYSALRQKANVQEKLMDRLKRIQK